MAKRPPVHCRSCGKEIDRDMLVEGKDWVMRSKNWYYHLNCYNSWIKSNEINSTNSNEVWFEYCWDYLVKDLKMSIDFNKMKKQWDSFLNKNMTAKGVYFCLKYFYDIKDGDKGKSQEGIGIVPFIYKEGCQYWVDREGKERGICELIEEQLKMRAAQEKIILKEKKKEKKKDKFSLESIAEMEE